MSEGYGLNFNVDASGIADGMQAYKSAVDGIQTSLKQFEQTATKTFASVAAASQNKSNLSAYAKSMQALADIPIDGAAARKITQLSVAIQGFKAPASSQSASLQAFFRSLSQVPDISSATRSITQLGRLSQGLASFRAPSSAQADNLKSFFKALSGIPDISGAARSIGNVAALGAGLAEFKAPSEAQSANLREFGKAVSAAMPGLEKLKAVSGLMDAGAELALLAGEIAKIKAPSLNSIASLDLLAHALKSFEHINLSNASGFGSAMAGITNFKAPSQGQIRNLVSFVDAIDKMKVPENTGAIAASLNEIAAAANKAGSSLGGFRASLGGGALKTVATDAHKAKIEMMGLQNSFSATFQAGSVLRSLLGSLTLGELGREFFSATQAANQFNASMEVISENPAFKAVAWDEARASANKFGTSLETYAAGFSKFAVAAKESGMGFIEARKVYDGFQTVSSALHLGTEQQQSVGLAIREMMDRGYVSTQQMTRQLGLVLPGALSTLKAAWVATGKSHDDIFTAMKKKEVDAQWALDVLADHYTNVYGKSVAQALQSPIQQFNILKNNIMEMMVQIGDAGAKSAFAQLIAQLSADLDPAAVKEFTKAISDGLVSALSDLSAGLKYLHDNWDSIKGPLGTSLKLLGEWMLVSSAFKVGSVIFAQLELAKTGFLTLRSSMMGIGAQMGAVTAEGTAMGSVWTGLTANLVPLNAGMEQFGFSAKMLTGSVTMAELESSIFARSLYAVMDAAVATGAAIKSATASIAALVVSEELGTVATDGMSVSLVAMNVATNAVRIGVNAATMSFSGLLGLVGGPVGAGLLLVAGGAMAVWSASSSLNAALGAQKGLLVDTQSALDGTNKLMGTYKATAADSATGTDVFGVSAGVAGGKIDTFAGKVGNAATQLRDMAKAARDAQLAQLDSQLTTLKTQQTTLSNNTVSGAYGTANAHSIGDAVGSVGNILVKSFLQGANQIVWNKNNEADAFKAAHQTQDQINQLQTARTALQNTPLETIATNSGVKDAAGTGGAHGPLYDGPKDNKPKKDKAFAELEAFESEFDAFEKKLGAGDSVTKIFDNWATSLTQGAKALLGKGGYDEALKSINFKAQDATESAKGIEAALMDPKNLTPAALKGLAKLHMSVGDLVEQIKASAAAADDAMADAVVKKYTDGAKATDTIMKKLAENNPVLKVRMEFDSTMLDNSKGLLNSTGMTQFEPTLEKLREGALSATQAVAALLGLLNNPANVKDGFTKVMPQIIAMINGEAIANKNAMKVAMEKDDFGHKALKGMVDEAMQYKMSSDQMEVYKKLQEAIADYKAKDVQLTTSQISGLQQQIEAQQKLNEHLKISNELHDSNGIREWAASTMQASDAVNELDKDLASGLEKTLEDIGKTGKVSFKSLFDSLQGTLVKKASQDLTKRILNGATGEQMFDPKTGQMSQTNTSVFNGFMGMDANSKVSADKWAGKSSAATNNSLSFYAENGALKVTMATLPDVTKKSDGTSAATSPASPVSVIDPSLGVPSVAAPTANTLSFYASNGALKMTATDSLGNALTGSGKGSGTGTGTGSGASSLTASLSAISKSSGTTADASTSPLSGLTGAAAKIGSVAQAGPLGGLLNTASGGIMGMIGGLGKLFTPSGPTGMAGVQNFLGIGSGGALSKLFGGGSSTAASGASGATSGIGGAISNIFGGGGSSGGAGDIASATTTAFGGAIDNVASSFTSQMGSSVGSISTDFSSSLGDAAKGIGSLLGGGSSGGSGGLGSLLGGGGDDAALGMFREGGYTGSPASSTGGSFYSFSNAPHFATGTSNTGNFAGGMPSILHQNEAVIPLSRGRSIPVQFNGSGPMASSQAQGGQHITFNVTSPDPDSFRKSQSQLSTQAYAVGTRAAHRNM